MSAPNLQKSFESAVGANDNTPRRQQKPFSIRFNEAERAELSRSAGKLSWAAYIRLKLFGEAVDPNRTKSRKRREPSVDRTALAQALGQLGQSRLSSNLNQIAKAANLGILPATPELAEELHAACADVRAMRNALIAALGLKPKGDDG